MDFLKAFSDGPHILAKIPIEGGYLKSEYFETAEGTAEWCKSSNPGHGLYYHVGTPRKNVRQRMKKPDVAELRYLWADVDPPKGYTDLIEEQAGIYDTLLQHDPQPTIIVNSGGGFQALWLLDKPIVLNNEEDIAEAERYTRFFVDSVGADPNSVNVDRILRLPDTINYPNATKRTAGRIEAPTSYEYFGGSYPLSAFEQAPVRVEACKDGSIDIDVEDRKISYTEENLPEGISSKWESLIVSCDESWYFEDSGYGSRSDVMIAMVRYLLENGYEHQVIYDILLSPALKISDHIFEKGAYNVDRYAKRQITEVLKRMDNKPAEEAKFIYTTPKEGDPKIIATSPHNVKLALLKSGRTFGYNEFSGVVLVDDVPFEKYHVTEALHDLEDKFKTTFASRLIDDTMQMLCYQNTFNPVVSYFRALPKWDGKNRIDTWLIDYCGAEDNALNRAYGRLTLLAATKRAIEPGCKFDEMLVLEGDQGDGKSEILRKGLCPNPRWFTDSVTLNRTRKEFMEDVSGHWIVECGELAGMRRANTEKLKALLSTTVDKARMAYARSRTDWPRRFILIGTTNQSDYLQDETGNRRFWCVECTGDLNSHVWDLSQVRDKLWAEALEAVDDGEKIRLDPALYAQSTARAKERLEDNPYAAGLTDAIGEMDGLVRVDELAKHLSITLDWHTQRSIGFALRRMGFRRLVVSKSGINVRAWKRGDENEWIVLVFDEAKEIL